MHVYTVLYTHNLQENGQFCRKHIDLPSQMPRVLNLLSFQPLYPFFALFCMSLSLFPDFAPYLLLTQTPFNLWSTFNCEFVLSRRNWHNTTQRNATTKRRHKKRKNIAYFRVLHIDEVCVCLCQCMCVGYILHLMTTKLSLDTAHKPSVNRAQRVLSCQGCPSL